MRVRPGWQLSVGILRRAVRLRSFKPFDLLRYSTYRPHTSVLQKSWVPQQLTAARRFSPGIILFLVAAPVSFAFGCGYWVGIATGNEKDTLPERGTGLQYGNEQALKDVCQISEYVNCINMYLRIASSRL